MKLSNAQILDLSRGIAAIDAGYDATIDGKNAHRSFIFAASWKVSYALARTGAAIKAPLEAIDKTLKALFEAQEPKENSKGDRQVPSDRQAAYQQATADFLAEEIDVAVHVLALDALKRPDDQAQVPAQAIAWLMPILTEDAKKLPE
jgi:hypothetical protein